MTDDPPSGKGITGTSTGWGNLFSTIEAGTGRILYVLGSTDRGKTSFCQDLISRLSQRELVAYLDLDPGQSTIGPPATLGLAFYRNNEEIPEERCLRFVGATSPRGHLLPILAGAKRLLERALVSESRAVIIDSPGYIHDEVATEFHLYLIDLLQPDNLVAIQEKDELEPILAHFRGHPSMVIHRLLPSPLARMRGSAERRRFREKTFREYFADTSLHDLPLEGLGIHGRLPDSFHPEHWQGLLVALCGPEQWVVALGIVESIDLTTQILRIRAPEFDPARVTSIHIGSMKMDLAGIP
ncbi:MAG: AAA family ATPase [Methanomicrobiales archaeon]|nr:AAA family ATPase [Methanomicrobiales archaeon]